MRSRSAFLLLICATTLQCTTRMTSRSGSLSSIDPAEVVAHLLDSTRAVAIGERHGWEEQRRFLVSLLGEERVANSVDVIAVECGSSGYQSLADRFTSGEPVARMDLQRIWRSTAAITLAPPSVCGEIFDIVRSHNAKRSARRIRVLLLQPPVDWFAVTASTRLDTVPVPDVFAARLLRREALSRNHRVLIITGSGHVLRPRREGRGTLVQQLEDSGATIFTIVPFDGFGDTPAIDSLERLLAPLPSPAVLRLANTPLGRMRASPLFSTRAQRMVNGVIVEEEVRQHEGSTLHDLFDALLYLGSRATMTRTADAGPALSDTVFIAELDRRSQLQFGRRFVPDTASDRRLFRR
jgi:hypothetical protein